MAVDKEQVLLGEPAGTVRLNEHLRFREPLNPELPLQENRLPIPDHGAGFGLEAIERLALGVNQAPGLIGSGETTAKVVAGLRAGELPGRTAAWILLLEVEGAEDKGRGLVGGNRRPGTTAGAQGQQEHRQQHSGGDGSGHSGLSSSSLCITGTGSGRGPSP